MRDIHIYIYIYIYVYAKLFAIIHSPCVVSIVSQWPHDQNVTHLHWSGGCRVTASSITWAMGSTCGLVVKVDNVMTFLHFIQPDQKHALFVGVKTMLTARCFNNVNNKSSINIKTNYFTFSTGCMSLKTCMTKAITTVLASLMHVVW